MIDQFRGYVLLLIFIFSSLLASSKEGMWLPLFLEKYNINEMQQMGCKLSPNDIYNVNNSSLKDAVVIFGGGCTGELISGEGLLITNHHCGLRYIQSHSNPENDYLTNGFWAMSREEELPTPGLKATFLVKMEDVTGQVLAGTDTIQQQSKKEKQIQSNIRKIEKEAVDDSHFTAKVKPLFHGNQYFLYVSEVFTDVRLVGAPPSSIGKFGGDTDNWMWPRHTGDFSLFRIYANKDNRPAEYSEDNIPFQPKRFFEINLSGVKQNDFTMIMGYPGRTSQYLPSQAVDMIMNVSDPLKIGIRTEKLNALRAGMEADPAVRIQYAAKYASTSNAWKKWKGEIKGLQRLNALEVKKAKEKEFKDWVDGAIERHKKYGEILKDFDRLYRELIPFQVANDYYKECILYGADIFSLCRKVDILNRSSLTDFQKEKAMKSFQKHFKDYHQPTDEEVFIALMNEFRNHVNEEFLPEKFKKRFQHKDEEKVVNKYYRKSILSQPERFLEQVQNDFTGTVNKLSNDKMFKLYTQLLDYYMETIMPAYSGIKKDIDAVQKKYMAGLIDMGSDEVLYPDANFTMRIAYGRVEGYTPKNGVKYQHFTTLGGIMEKDDPEIYDYNVPEKLRHLYRQEDYGIYANEEGKLPVAFIASNHTTGGNSGSPVIDENGRLIGINFDRCWEGTMSDIMFDPEKCRNIALDIRYALFIIEKFAGAGYLIDEMSIHK